MYSNGGTAAELERQLPAMVRIPRIPADWAFSGRIAWKPSGTWEQFDEMTSPQGTEAGILVGMGWAVMDGDDKLIDRQ